MAFPRMGAAPKFPSCQVDLDDCSSGVHGEVWARGNIAFDADRIAVIGNSPNGPLLHGVLRARRGKWVSCRLSAVTAPSLLFEGSLQSLLQSRLSRWAQVLGAGRFHLENKRLASDVDR